MGGASNNNGGGGGGSPNQMAKDKAAKDKAVRDKEARQAKIREEQKNKRPTPKDDNKVIAPKPKPTVPKIKFTPKDDERDKQKVIVPKKKIDFKPVTKEVLNPNDNIQEKKKTPIVTPKDDALVEIGKGNITGAVKKIVKGPTIAEVDQATTDTTPTETAETTEKNRLLKVKKRGRSSSIMTSAKGVTKTSSDYSLGRSSLLGRV